MKQRRPNTEAAAIRRDMESRGYIVTPEKIAAFIREGMRHPYQPPSEENVRAAAALLVEMMAAARSGSEWGEYRSRVGVKKWQPKAYDVRFMTADDEVFGIVRAELAGRLTAKQAIAELKARLPYDTRQIQRIRREAKARLNHTNRRQGKG